MLGTLKVFHEMSRQKLDGQSKPKLVKTFLWMDIKGGGKKLWLYRYHKKGVGAKKLNCIRLVNRNLQLYMHKAIKINAKFYHIKWKFYFYIYFIIWIYMYHKCVLMEVRRGLPSSWNRICRWLYTAMQLLTTDPETLRGTASVLIHRDNSVAG